MKRPMLIVVALAVLAVSGTACTDTEGGTPVGTQTPSVPSGGSPFPTGGSKTPTSTSTSRGADRPLARIEPCSLLTPDEWGQLGVLQAGRTDISGASRACVFGSSAGQGFAMTVTIHDERGLGDIASRSEIKPLTLGRHEAAQFTGGFTSCAFAIKVTESSRVDSSASTRDVPTGCQIAKRAAEFVEKKLP